MSKTDSFFNPEQYATVAERIEMFYSRYPEGRINTELVSRSDGTITFKAVVYRDANDTTPAATGWASEREGDSDINTVACLENTETSAVGRALANLGFVASAKRPSREEMAKAARVRTRMKRAGPREAESLMLQPAADEAADLTRLIKLAERQSFPLGRAAIVRGRLTTAQGLSPRRLQRLEERLRDWLRRHQV